MKHTLLILYLLLACTFSSNAQSEATWEETIDFILNYSSNLRDASIIGRDDLPLQLSNFKITDNALIFQYIDGYHDRIWDMQLDLTKLLKVEIEGRYGVFLKFTGEYDLTNFNKKVYDTMKRRYFSFGIIDSEMRNRYYKAFTHLSKLVTEKKEAERKASGDKF